MTALAQNYQWSSSNDEEASGESSEDEDLGDYQIEGYHPVHVQ